MSRPRGLQILATTSVAVIAGVVAGATLLVASPAYATAPTGGCWVWYAGTPSSDISSSLAPWTDPNAAPAGPADHPISLAPANPAPGETVTATYTFNKGPKNSGPAASVTGQFVFSVNGTTISASKDYGSVAGGQVVPATSVTAQFVAAEGVNTVTLQKAIFRAPAFDIQIDCNGQTSGTVATNPRTAPLPTNVTASVTGSGASVSPSLTPSPTTSATPSPSPSASATAVAERVEVVDGRDPDVHGEPRATGGR